MCDHHVTAEQLAGAIRNTDLATLKELIHQLQTELQASAADWQAVCTSGVMYGSVHFAVKCLLAQITRFSQSYTGWHRMNCCTLVCGCRPYVDMIEFLADKVDITIQWKGNNKQAGELLEVNKTMEGYLGHSEQHLALFNRALACLVTPQVVQSMMSSQSMMLLLLQSQSKFLSQTVSTL